MSGSEGNSERISRKQVSRSIQGIIISKSTNSILPTFRSTNASSPSAASNKSNYSLDR
ncbi:hypothetical protein GLW08_02500 [Pontibacillus yanchengensis]|uniref:Uncharacterized protein n=1 Tax=Pontibacillus yanchengensis TaxID=462910 RepID=A0ACC7VC19_9BACI|nr:hypothetical protein [Pontibacillus yanchengensis]MYL52205.1 hypothetical protein [Pontibacillus yanchengensis]